MPAIKGKMDKKEDLPLGIRALEEGKRERNKRKHVQIIHIADSKTTVK